MVVVEAKERPGFLRPGAVTMLRRHVEFWATPEKTWHHIVKLVLYAKHVHQLAQVVESVNRNHWAGSFIALKAVRVSTVRMCHSRFTA